MRKGFHFTFVYLNAGLEGEWSGWAKDMTTALYRCMLMRSQLTAYKAVNPHGVVTEWTRNG